MKKVFLLILIINCQLSIINLASAQVGEWVWIHGSNTTNSVGYFSAQGVFSALNHPPALYEPCEWTDLNGNFWLYGGRSQTASMHNDLWKYDPLINQWAWMTGSNTYNDSGNFGVKGVPAAINRPPSIGWAAASWTDLNGNLWMWGGYNYTGFGGDYNALWKYDISTNIWTWMKGASTYNSPGVYGIQGVPDTANNPRARHECAVAWTDNAGDLWMFGGLILGGGGFNDLWRYNIASNTWTWMKGSNVLLDPGVLGTQGVESPANVPSGRAVYSHWKDNKGNLWLFGGNDFTNSLNDLWRYNPVTNNFTWMNGNNAPLYGSKCVTTSSNSPPVRWENRASWTDANGNFWMFGGKSATKDFNDLWMYCVTSNEWTWEGGDSIVGSLGNWGTLNVSSPSNVPNGRNGSIGWTDKKGHLYLFGGWTSPAFNCYNDLWIYTIDSSCGSCAQSLPHSDFNASDTAFCTETGKCLTFFDHSSGNPISWHWLFPGAIPDSSSKQNPDSICYYTPGTYSVTLIVANSAGTDTFTVSPMITYSSGALAPTLTLSHDTIFCSHELAYQWYFNGAPIPGATDSFYVATKDGTYNIYITDSAGCSRLGNGISFVEVKELISESQVNIYPNPVSDEMIVSFTMLLSKNPDMIITDMVGKELFRKTLERSNIYHIISTNELSNGIYLLQIQLSRQKINKKFIVVHK